jgi:hypothetical protein
MSIGGLYSLPADENIAHTDYRAASGVIDLGTSLS